jgi:hypothetical protein
MFSDAYFIFSFLAIIVALLGFRFGWALSSFDESDSLADLRSQINWSVFILAGYGLIFLFVAGYASWIAQKIIMASGLFVAFQCLRIVFLVRDKKVKKMVTFRN